MRCAPDVDDRCRTRRCPRATLTNGGWTTAEQSPAAILDPVAAQRSHHCAHSGLRLFGRGRPESRRERVMSVRQRVWGAKILRGALSPRTWSRAEERQSARAQRLAGTVRARGSVCTWAGRRCGGPRVRQSIDLPHGRPAGRGPRARIGRSVRGQAEQRSAGRSHHEEPLEQVGTPSRRGPLKTAKSQGLGHFFPARQSMLLFKVLLLEIHMKV